MKDIRSDRGPSTIYKLKNQRIHWYIQDKALMADIIKVENKKVHTSPWDTNLTDAGTNTSDHLVSEVPAKHKDNNF